MISPHAIIDPSAKIEDGVIVGPFSIIEKNVVIRSGTQIASHVTVKGATKIGKDNVIYQFASIGEDCQDKKYHGEHTELVIGDNNVFREGCTIHRGTVQGGGKTKIGNNNLFMVNTHVAHDCYIGDNVIFSNGASIAGHVLIQDYVVLGGLVGIHQFCKIGAHSFAAGGSIIYKDVLPYVTVSGNPAKSHGLNRVGLQRRDFSSKSIDLLKNAYKIVFKQSNTVAEAIALLSALQKKSPDVIQLIEFLQSSERGIVR